MLNTNVSNFRKNIFAILEQTIKYNEPVNVSTKEGNAIILSEEDYNGLMETLYLSSNPQVRDEIIEGLNTPLDECLPETEVAWSCIVSSTPKRRPGTSPSSKLQSWIKKRRR